MQDSRPSLYVYFITSVCVLIFYVLKMDDFITLVKPIIVPAIYFYYLQKTGNRINLLFTAAIWLFFAADMIEIVDDSAGIYWIMAFTLASYVIMMRFAVLDNIKMIVSWKSIVVSVLALSTIAVFSTQIINQTQSENTVYFYFFVLYTILALSMFGYAIMRFFSKNDLTSRLFLMMVVAMVLSDLLYSFNKYVNYSISVALISFTAQFASYYFMVEYFIKRDSIAK